MSLPTQPKRDIRTGSSYLLVDFGTTSTKSALVDLDSGLFSHLLRHPSIPPQPAPSGRCEISLEAIALGFEQICTSYLELTERDAFAGIVICSEMHGFAVLDRAPPHRPLTPYISWLDQRSLEPVNGVDTFAMITDRLGSGRFKAVTGMRLRPGLPLLNLVHWARSAPDVPPVGLVVSLPGWLALNANAAAPGHIGAPAGTGSPAAECVPPVEHPTMLAGMAFYDVNRHEVSRELLDLVRDLTGFSALLGECASGAAAVAGHWYSDDGAIPIYAGVGDHQCSLLGAGLTPGDCASVNLGTGSQVSVLIAPGSDRPLPGSDEVELRPYFDADHLLRTITHIPAGRALTEYIGFLHRIADAALTGVADADAASSPDAEMRGPRPAVNFWQQLTDLAIDDLDSSTLQFDLSIFQGSRNYSTGGSLSRIEEGSLTPRNYLASLLNSFVRQYSEALQVIDPEHQLERILLSGGIARNLLNLTDLFTSLTGYSALPATDLDESLLGLRSLALVADGRAGTWLEAQQLFGCLCEVAETS
ncbi:MAG TPA: hypothetical protein EYM39_13135 [Candidatus Latescibacteria bacterium]|nr:hypothetical protein [Candidatus Latescibacterota bacterium]